MKRVGLIVVLVIVLAASFLMDAALPVAVAAPGKRAGASAPHERAEKPSPAERPARSESQAQTEPPALKESAEKPSPAERPVRLSLSERQQTAGQAYTQAQPVISAETAEDAALDAVGGGIVARVELKYPKHGAEYKVIIVDDVYKYDIKVSASTGLVTGFKSHLINTVGRAAYNNGYVPGIDAEYAKDIAIDAADGGVVTSCKLDYKARLGLLIYHIHVTDGQYETCIELDAYTGDILKTALRYKP